MDKECAFKYFKTSRGDNVFKEWLNTLSVKVRAKIRVRIKYLETEKKWDVRYFKKLTGYTNLYEIRIKFQSNEYRPIGCFNKDKEEKEFIILIGAIEKGNKFEPAGAANTAYTRSKLIGKMVNINGVLKEKHVSEY